MENINIWWEALTSTEQVLYCLAVPATLLLVIQAILIMVGAGGDALGADVGGLDTADGMFGGDVDGTSGGGKCEGSSDFGIASMFTIQGIASLFCVFGWAALGLIRSGVPGLFAFPIAFAAGVGVMYGLARLMVAITKLGHTGTLEVKNLLGSTGTVYLTIPGKGEGKGKVSVQTSERLVEFDAVSETDPIANNAAIRVIDILGENVLVVEPV